MLLSVRLGILIPSVAVVLLSNAALGQSRLYTFDGVSAMDGFGWSVSGAGDVNGDGFNDLIVGASGNDCSASNSGHARVFSGADGSTLYTFCGDSDGDQLGVAVSGAGDVNGDGFADLIVGANGDDNNGDWTGSARVFSGFDGSVLYTFDGDSVGDELGRSVSGAGDVNGDGFDDLIVGAPSDDNNGTWSGSARVFSGVDGSILYTFFGDSEKDSFGSCVSDAGDVNADGYDDMIVGAWGDNNNGSNSGSARVFSGLDGSVLYTFDGDAKYDVLGYSVSGAGDVNGDGFADLIVGIPKAKKDDRGNARVFSGLDGSTLFTFHGDSPQDQFGSSVASAGDVNGDGFADLIVGSEFDDNNGQDSGSASVFSGKNGKLLYRIDGDAADEWSGGSVDDVGDLDGDGRADLIVGAGHASSNGHSSGSARVFSGCDSQGTTYCSPGVPNSTGFSAEIGVCGSDGAADNFLHLSAKNLPADRFGYFLLSRTRSAPVNPPGSQGNLCLGGQIGRFKDQTRKSGSTGIFGIPVDLTDAPLGAVLAGQTWSFQAWYRDVNPSPTSNFTDAISVLFR